MVGVAWFGDDDDFSAFVSTYGLTFPQISDSDGVVFARFGVPSQPAFVVISPDGRVQVELGAVDAATIDAMLSAASA